MANNDEDAAATQTYLAAYEQVVVPEQRRFDSRGDLDIEIRRQLINKRFLFPVQPHMSQALDNVIKRIRITWVQNYGILFRLSRKDARNAARAQAHQRRAAVQAAIQDPIVQDVANHYNRRAPATHNGEARTATQHGRAAPINANKRRRRFGPDKVVPEHIRIARLIASRDPEETTRVVRKHFARTTTMGQIFTQEKRQKVQSLLNVKNTSIAFCLEALWRYSDDVGGAIDWLMTSPADGGPPDGGPQRARFEYDDLQPGEIVEVPKADWENARLDNNNTGAKRNFMHDYLDHTNGRVEGDRPTKKQDQRLVRPKSIARANFRRDVQKLFEQSGKEEQPQLEFNRAARASSFTFEPPGPASAPVQLARALSTPPENVFSSKAVQERFPQVSEDFSFEETGIVDLTIGVDDEQPIDLTMDDDDELPKPKRRCAERVGSATPASKDEVALDGTTLPSLFEGDDIATLQMKREQAEHDLRAKKCVTL